jgi:raffinose/stachyose/melibiose transport system substrate-binding protein
MAMHPQRGRLRLAFARLAAIAGSAVLLGACGTGTSNNGSAGSSGGGGGKVTLNAVMLTDFKPQWTAAIKQFEHENPNITVNTSYGPVDQLQTQLRARLAAGNAPDVHTVWPGNGSAMSMTQLAQANLLSDLSGQDWINRVPDNLKQLIGLNGKTYIWTPGMAVIGAIYNKDVFKKAGVQIPTTWSQLLAACRTFKSKGITPIALGNQTPWVTQLIDYAIAPSVAFGNDPDLAQEMLQGKKTFSDSGWRQTLQRYMQLKNDGFFQPNPNGTTVEQMYNLVASGKAAMLVSVSSVLPQVEAASKGRAHLGLFQFPAADSAGQLKIPAGVSAGVGVSANSKHQAEAKKLVEFLGRPEVTQTFAEGLQQIPLGVTADQQVKPAILQPFVKYVADGRSVPFMDQQWPNAQVQPVHFAVVQDLFADKITVDDALHKLDEAYKQK